MIKLERVRTAAAITTALRGKRRISRNVELLEGFREDEFKFKSSVWKNAKEQLKTESGEKCAYCESPTAVVAHGDVEHFRPKSIYWWLAYCYDNYLYSCQICNQSFKSNHFPVPSARMEPNPPVPDPLPDTLTQAEMEEIAAVLTPDPLHDDQGRPMAQFIAEATAERPGLIDPYTIDPVPFFKWGVDDTLQEVALESVTNDPEMVCIFEATRDFLGLNRGELLKERYKTYDTLEGFKELFKGLPTDDPLRDIAVDQIKDMMANDAAYAGMVRYFVNVEWQLDLD